MRAAKLFFSGFILLSLFTAVSAEGLLKLTCINTFTSDFVGPMWVGDLKGNGLPYVVVGTRVNGLVNAYKYKGYDCNNDWSPVQSGGFSHSTGGDVQSLYVGSLKGTENRLLVNGIESTYNKASKITNYVTALNPAGGDDWAFREQCGVTYTVSAGDVDNTGIKNAIMGTKGSKVCVLKDNPITKTPLLWSYSTQRPVYVVLSDDVDGDGKVEVIALDRKGEFSTVYCISNTGALKWKYDVAGGIYIASIAGKMLSIADLNGDGKKEVIVGTYNHGVDVLDSSGRLEWNYQTKSASNDLVSVVYPYDVNGDGKLEVLVGAKPYLYVLSHSGGLVWKAPVDTMVYGIAVGNIYGGGANEVVASATRYVYVFDDEGEQIDRWAYTVEIQGTNSLFQEKDANGNNVAIADLDGDGRNEVVTSFGWQEDRDIITYYYGDLRVFEVNQDYAAATTTTTLSIEEEATSTTIPYVTETTVESNGPETTLGGKKSGGLCCLPLLPAIFALVLSLWLGYPVR